FAGECRVDGPCQQICFDLHDGTFECGCSSGYHLSSNGYGCEREPTPRRTGSSDSDSFDGDDDPSARYESPLNTVAATTTTATSPHDGTFGPAAAAESCDALGCSPGGRCVQDERRGGVRCACSLGKGGPFCDQEVELRHPRFSGGSYLALPTLRDAHKSMQVSLQFRPETHDALLLYSGETPELLGDYFAIVLDKGFVEFDCGMGQGILRSDQPVLLNAWNTLTVYRDRWDAWMQLNSGHQVQGRSKGLFSRITLRLHVYLGGSPNASLAAGRLGTREGLVGCVRRLEINGRRYDFRSGGRGDAIGGIDVDDCGGDACSRVVCQNGGQCIATGAERGVCLCALGFAGSSCETPVEIVVPSFNGSSYLRFSGLGNAHLSYLDVQVAFKPLSPHGLFFYNGCKMDGTGDFVALQMANGYVEFRFDLSSGTAVLRQVRSHRQQLFISWHTVRASRTGRLGSLSVDEQPRVEAHSPGAFTQLSLPLNLYLGGVPDPGETASGAAVLQSFVGCVQRLTINNRPLRLMQEALSGVNVANCVHPCVTGPCYNGGACQPRMDLYSCHCKLGYAGSNCQTEVKEAIAEPMMGGASYLHYTSDDIMKRQRGRMVDVQLAFRSFSSHGLLLWAGDAEQRPTSDFVSLGLEKGQLTLRYNLGSGEAALVCNASRVDDGRWHWAHLSRSQQAATLALDKSAPVAVTAPGRLRQLNVHSGLYVGGVGDVSHVTRGRYKSGLVGCVANLTLATDLHVRLVSHAATGINVQPCL
ncbi:unnamed protein product, partial [Ixodes hexagonus]